MIFKPEARFRESQLGLYEVGSFFLDVNSLGLQYK